MLIEALLATGVLSVALVWIRRNRPPRSQPLPAPGGEPEDREEAIRRVLKHFARKKIGELVEGEGAVLVGRVVAIQPAKHVRSLATNTPCLGYAIEVSLRTSLETLRLHTAHRSAAVDFVLADETGEIVVRAQSLELAFSTAQAAPYYPPWPAWLVQWLPRLIGARDVLVRVKEGHLHEGARLVVCGVVTQELGAESYRHLSARMALVGNASFPLVASPDEDLFEPGAQPVSPAELVGGRSGEG